jgi:hypothetical protein
VCEFSTEAATTLQVAPVLGGCTSGGTGCTGGTGGSGTTTGTASSPVAPTSQSLIFVLLDAEHTLQL